jgi:hypothetical protein
MSFVRTGFASNSAKIRRKNVLTIPYKSLILGQLLDLISPAKINLFEPRFESYDPVLVRSSAAVAEDLRPTAMVAEV